MNIKEMYNCGKEIEESQSLKNKYMWAGYNNLIDIRYFDVNDTFSLQTPLNDMIRKNGSIMLLPNIVNNRIIDLNIRYVEEKSILTYKLVDLPYGAGYLREDFKYGDPIVIVEGIGDYAALKFIDKDMDVLAMRSSSIAKDMYDTYASITNNYLLLADNDETGQKSINKIRKKFGDMFVNLEVLNQFSNFKDSGDLIDKIIEYSKTKSDDTKLEIGLAIKYYLSQINLYK